MPSGWDRAYRVVGRDLTDWRVEAVHLEDRPHDHPDHVHLHHRGDGSRVGQASLHHKAAAWEPGHGQSPQQARATYDSALMRDVQAAEAVVYRLQARRDAFRLWCAAQEEAEKIARG